MISEQILLWLAKASILASALTLAVLATKGHVSKWVGARGAVLLWAIPAAQLLMPPLPKTVTVAPAGPTTGALTAPAIDLSAYTALTSTALPAVTPPEPILTWTSVSVLLLMMWALGTFIYIARVGLQTRSLRAAACRLETPISSELSKSVARAADEVGLRQIPKIVVTEAVETPMLLGIFKPMILLPSHFEQTYTPFEQRHALLHECVHVKRGDLVFAWAATVLTAVQWFNPIAHRANAAFRLDQESACDEAVRALGVPCRDYAATLVKSARVGFTPVPAMTLNHGLTDRIRRMGAPLPSRTIVQLATVGISAIALAAATGTAGTFTIERQDSEPQEESDKATVSPKVSVRTMSLQDGATVVVLDDGAETSRWVSKDGDGDNVFVQRQNGKVMITTGDGKPFSLSETDGNSVVLMPQGGIATALSKLNLMTDGDTTTVHVQSGTDGFYLIGNPFEGVTPPTSPEMDFDFEMPTPPEPTTAPPPPENVEGGQWVFIPDPPDMSDFDVDMTKFEKKMAFFEEEMSLFGGKLGRIGEAVGDLSKKCTQQRLTSSDMKILSQRHPEKNERIRALCVPTGDKALATEEMVAFVKGQRSLSDKDKERLIHQLQKR